MMDPERTIAAQATPPGQGALAVIRMSGRNCLSVLQQCTKLGVVAKLEPRRATLAVILDAAGEPLDQVLLTYFAAPASYTGQDTVELSCHGGMLVTELLLQRLYQCGANPAQPGEFTQRAFLNNRMDLTRAEAVMDIISAGSDMALKAAQNQLAGGIGDKVNAIKTDLLHTLAHIEAYIDFPEEDIQPRTLTDLLARLQDLRSRITDLLRTAAAGRLLRSGIRTAIVGAPNAGKSSLLNTMLGYERAIVSPVPGTTRDTVEELVQFAGLPLRLIDTAGIRSATDTVEQAGIHRAKQAMQGADLVIRVVDASQARTAVFPEEEISTDALSAPQVLVLNKCDLGIHEDWRLSEGIVFSCLTGSGMQDLQAALTALFNNTMPIDSGSVHAAINARHQTALTQAGEYIDRAVESLRTQQSPELVALDLRESLLQLGEITGAVDTEQLLDVIFSTFCLGK